MKLAGVIVWYYPTQDNIDQIKSFLPSLDRLFVIDNSDDNDLRIKNSKKIKYIKYGKNYGIAKALNDGAKEAIKEGFQWLMTLDQDSHMTSDMIDQMKDYLINHKDSSIGVISPYHDIDGRIEYSKDVEETLEIMTSGNIINLDIFQKVKGFKEWLFIDCVDTEYYMNLIANHYKVIRLNKVVMKHPLGKLEVHKIGKKEYQCYNHNPIRRYYIMRNNLYLNQMYKNLFPEECKHLLRIQNGQVKRILLFEHQKIAKIKMMIKGYRDFKKNKKGPIEL